ncbi:ABC transporter substrate-binding protein [Pontibacter arcticus]|uniref:ABC transporter substrate-binding protein n=1 Tax=Pontibacter arcticus TaxID=2080288 RepID=A0A364RH40_9BACT|nr:ABC transporter substrate-binding protein [Pontibacter arcticus]
MAADPENLNPVSYTKADALQIINLIFQALLTVDLADNTIKPALADALPVIARHDSVTHFTYRLREEASWADGSPVTAKDVAFTLKVMKAPLLHNEQLKPQVAFIQDIVLDAADAKKFTLVCQGFTPEMQLLTGDFFILPAYLFDPKKLLDSYSVTDFTDDLSRLENDTKLKTFATWFNSPDFNRSAALLKGSAGYELENWTTAQYVTLKRKTDWWGNNLRQPVSYVTANPTRISFQIIPDNTTALLALKNKQIDILDNIPAAEFTNLKNNKAVTETYALYTPDAFDLVYAGLNTRQPKFGDKQTRQAIAHLLDINSFIKISQQSYASPTVGPVPPSVKTYYNNGLTPVSFAPAKATQLLTSAGWRITPEGWFRTVNGEKQHLTINLIFRAGNTAFENSALIFQQAAAKAGIPVNVQAIEGSVVSQQVQAHTFDMFFRTLTGNPFFFNFKPLFHTSYSEQGGSNATGFGTTESDRLLDEFIVAESEEKKAALLKRLQAILQEEAAFISLYYQKDRIAIRNKYENLKISGLSPNYDVSAFKIKN